MKFVPMVVGLAVAAAGSFGAQSSTFLARSEFEAPLLMVWGAALLLLGHRVKAHRRRQLAIETVTPELASNRARAGAHAA